MSTFILNTVGISLLTRIRRERNLGPVQRPDHRDVLDELNRLAPDHENCGAEINSLHSLIKRAKVAGRLLEPPYELLFLVSQTPDGEWTGRLLKAYWESGKRDLNIDSVEIEVVEGLQPNDPQLFAREGLCNLVKLSCRFLDRNSDRNRVINATGGYKAQISFAGLIGQTISVPVIYLFEGFPFYIEMPPMPVDFSRDLWLEHYDLFKQMDESGSIETDDPGLDGADPVFINLLDRVEDDGNYLYALSPVLLLMHHGFLMRPWPREVRQPHASAITPKDKLAVNESEMPHAPRGSLVFMKQMAELDWVERVSNIKFANTGRSRIISRKDPDQPNEIQLYFSDGRMALVIAVRTTSTDDGERTWCIHQLAEILNS